MRTAALLVALISTLAAPAAGAPAGAAPPPARPQPEAKPRWETLPLPPKMPKPEASARVSVAGGAEIYYAAFGKADAPPVILLHGGLGNGDHFANQVPVLAERFRVIAIDSRGQGRSTLGKVKGQLSYASMADDVVEVMKALKLEKASVAGWSDGGAVALALAIDHPERVDRLFVFATNYNAKGSKPRGSSAPTFTQYMARCRDEMARLGKKGAFDAAVVALGPVWRDPESFKAGQLRTIKARTLIADGDHDEVIQLAQIEEMATKLIPNAKVAVLKGTSHFALWQDPAGFTKLLVDFLTEP